MINVMICIALFLFPVVGLGVLGSHVPSRKILPESKDSGVSSHYGRHKNAKLGGHFPPYSSSSARSCPPLFYDMTGHYYRQAGS